MNLVSGLRQLVDDLTRLERLDFLCKVARDGCHQLVVGQDVAIISIQELDRLAAAAGYKPGEKYRSAPTSTCVKPGTNIQAWPEDQPKRYNGSGEPCDAWDGPCCCGAWHQNGR